MNQCYAFFCPKRKVKTLADSDSDDDEVTAWVEKSRKIQKEKETTEKAVRMKLLYSRQ